MSDATVPTGRQLRMARAALGLGCGELALSCGLRISDVLLAEDGSATDDVRRALRCMLESCGIEFGSHGWIRHHRDAAQPKSAAAPPSSPGARSSATKSAEVSALAIGPEPQRARTTQGLTQEQTSERPGANTLVSGRPSYVEAFEQLWGSCRDVFDGVPRDEHGIPVQEPEEEQS